MTESSGPDSLSRREVEVLESWMRHGMHKRVASELFLSEQTVKNHVSAILRKMDAVSIGQAALRYDRWIAEQGHRREHRSGVDRRQASRRRA